MTAEFAPLSPDDPRSTDKQLEDLVAFLGYRPNALLTMARKPGLLPAVMGLVQVCIRGPSSITPELRFLVACEASRTACCFYSAAHAVHGAHHLGVPWSKLSELDVYPTSSHYSADERAALCIATAGGTLPTRRSQDTFQLARLCFTDEQCLDIVTVVAAFGWFNRWNGLIGSCLEDVPSEALQHVRWLADMAGA